MNITAFTSRHAQANAVTHQATADLRFWTRTLHLTTAVFICFMAIYFVVTWTAILS